jgi:hypothetical protein
MKIVAQEKHKCYCCGTIIAKGEQCFALFVNPSDPNVNEFDVIYTCSKCAGQDSCQTRIRRRGGTSP